MEDIEIERMGEDDSDTVDSSIAFTEIVYLKELADFNGTDVRIASGEADRALSIPEDPWSVGQPTIRDGHRLEIPGFELSHAYELEPRRINGRRYFEYGVDATNNKQPFAGFILHHMGDSPFNNSLEYILRRDEDRGGTFGYHFLIGRDGKTVQAAPLSKRTNHVGSGSTRTAQKKMVNNNTISVSLHGGYRSVGKKYIFIPPTEIQLKAAKTVLVALSRAYKLGLGNAWGHGEVQSDRMAEEGLVLAQWSRKQAESKLT